MMRTLRDLNAQLRQGEAQPVGGPGRDGGDRPAEMDEFRMQLARRIEAFVAMQADADADAEAEQG